MCCEGCLLLVTWLCMRDERSFTHCIKMAGVEALYKNFGILADAGEKIAEV